MTLDRRWWRQAASLACTASRAMCLKREEGGSLVEFAVVVPLLMTVLTGTASFALGFYSLQQLSTATASAVQAVANQRGEIPNGDPCALVAQVISANTPSTYQGVLSNWTASNISYTLVITDSAGSAHSYSGTGSSFSCLAGGVEQALGEPLTLTVSYKYSWMPILSFSPSSPLMTSSAAMSD